MTTRGLKVGVLGGGQLGRMLALAGYPLGLRFRFLDPSPDAPAGQLAEQLVAGYDDKEVLAEFADGLDVATWEFENVPAAAALEVARHVTVLPPPSALACSQDRAVQRDTLSALGLPGPETRRVSSRDELDRAIADIGLPAVLKTRTAGYDGKGQAVLRSASDVPRAWETLGSRPLILERFVPFSRELSILAVRSTKGETAFYPLTQNVHEGGILRESSAPADVTPELRREAEELARRALDGFGYAGVLTIEMFEHEGRLLVNEIALRVHNSGHWTIEGATTSQFENHLRAILGLPLGEARALDHSVMVNLIGDVPRLDDLLAIPGVHLHLYGKDARPHRKLGHVTLNAPTRADLAARLERVHALVRAPAG